MALKSLADVLDFVRNERIVSVGYHFGSGGIKAVYDSVRELRKVILISGELQRYYGKDGKPLPIFLIPVPKPEVDKALQDYEATLSSCLGGLSTGSL